VQRHVERANVVLQVLPLPSIDRGGVVTDFGVHFGFKRGSPEYRLQAGNDAATHGYTSLGRVLRTSPIASDEHVERSLQNIDRRFGHGILLF
jgi:hypothetical protein